jgi:ribosome-associated heat shock protein Hsp15
MNPPKPSAVRLDKWLWAARVYKTRGLAATACREGRVEINGLKVKPSHEARPGELIIARTDAMTRTVRVLALLDRRVGAALAKEFAEDLTPPSEYEKRSELSLRTPLFRPPGAGRPTKKERRTLEKFLQFGNNPPEPPDPPEEE